MQSRKEYLIFDGFTSSVVILRGRTGYETGQAHFFEAWGISTTISQGWIALLNDVELVKAGEKTTASQAALLQTLGIETFTYGLTVRHGSVRGEVFDYRRLQQELLETKVQSWGRLGHGTVWIGAGGTGGEENSLLELSDSEVAGAIIESIACRGCYAFDCLVVWRMTLCPKTARRVAFFLSCAARHCTSQRAPMSLHSHPQTWRGSGETVGCQRCLSRRYGVRLPIHVGH